jgi:uncharacterized protein
MNLSRIKYLFFVVVLFHSATALSQGWEVRNYHDKQNSQIKESICLLDSGSHILHGPYTAFYINGTIEKTGFYKNNVPDSIWTYFYESGLMKMKGTMRNGVNHGLWEYFFENGNRSMAGMIMDSKREGAWKYYYENGQLKSEGEYKGDVKQGIWNYFYEEGILKAQEYNVDGVGKYKEFYASGNLKAEGLNKSGVSDSTWVFYYENGKVNAKGKYKNGKRVGEWVFYHENEVISARGSYVDGLEQGKWEYFHDNGTMSSEGAVKNGKKDGYWRFFNELGLFNAKGIYENDSGKYTEYYESGKIKVEGDVVDGKNNGVWVYFYEDGNREGECTFNHGDGDYIGYYPNGSIKMKGHIKNGINVGTWELYDEQGILAGYYHPYYEDNRPVYKLIDQNTSQKSDYSKPAYKYKSYKSRYFDPVINEFTGHIISFNPLATLMGQLPVSYEHYFAERLGYEGILGLIRNPFYSSGDDVDLNQVYDRGFYAAFRQKYYHPEGKLGMFYFGQELRVTSINHYSNVLDSGTVVAPPFEEIQLQTTEARIEYGLFIGDRWIHFFGKRFNKSSLGISFDAFAGFGFGYRFYSKKYPESKVYDAVFKDVNDSEMLITPRVGFTVGLIF